MEGNLVDDRDEEERPVRAAVGSLTVPAVVDRQEYVSDLGKVREGTADALDVHRLHQQERHARPQKHDARLGVLGQDLSLEPSANISILVRSILKEFEPWTEATGGCENQRALDLLFPKGNVLSSISHRSNQS